MTHYSGSVPETRRAADWRDSAACTTDPDVLYPGTNRDDIARAKAVCHGCPVVSECLRYALDKREEHGVWGGLSTRERRAILRSAARRKLNADAVNAKIEQIRNPEPPRSLEDLVEDNTTWLPHGHLAWTGPRKIRHNGQLYTPKQACFTADRGTKPDGQVTSTCGVTECVLSAHIADVEERSRCGTRAGYRRHLQEKTEICGPCRQANTDADNLLRRTGTTKARVAA